MRIHTSHLMIVAAGLALAIVPALAEARTSSAFGNGMPTPGAYYCWSESFGAAINSGCTNTQRLVLPVVLDTTGVYKTVTVNAYGSSSSHSVSCYAQGRSADTFTFSDSGTVALTSYGVGQDLVLSGAYVPVDGNLDVYCFAKEDGQISSYRY